MPRILDVTPIKEAWGTYELEDGLVLRVRPMLGWVELDPKNPGGMNIRTSVVVLTAAPDSLRGAPSGNPFDPSKEEPVQVYRNVKVVTPAESVYLLPNGAIVKIQVTIQEVRRYKHINQDGEPFLQVAQLLEMMSTATPDGKLLKDVKGMKGESLLEGPPQLAAPPASNRSTSGRTEV